MWIFEAISEVFKKHEGEKRLKEEPLKSSEYLLEKLSNMSDQIVEVPCITTGLPFGFRYTSAIKLNMMNRSAVIGGWVERGEIIGSFYYFDFGRKIYIASPVNGRIISCVMEDPFGDPFAKIQLAKNENVPLTAEPAFALLRETIMNEKENWPKIFGGDPSYEAMDNYTKGLLDFKIVPRPANDEEQRRIEDLDLVLATQKEMLA